MKKLVLILAIAFCFYGSKTVAQEGLKFGVTGGFLSLKYNRIEVLDKNTYSGNGYNFGIPATVGFNDRVAGMAQVGFSSRTIEQPTFEQVTNFAEFPFGLKYRSSELGNGNRWYSTTLMSPEFMYKGYSHNTVDTVILDEQVNRINIGYRLGIGYEKETYFGTFMLGATYYTQFTNLAKQNYVDAQGNMPLEEVTVKMSGWYFNLTYLL